MMSTHIVNNIGGFRDDPLVANDFAQLESPRTKLQIMFERWEYERMKAEWNQQIINTPQSMPLAQQKQQWVGSQGSAQIDQSGLSNAKK